MKHAYNDLMTLEPEIVKTMNSSEARAYELLDDLAKAEYLDGWVSCYEEYIRAMDESNNTNDNGSSEENDDTNDDNGSNDNNGSNGSSQSQNAGGNDNDATEEENDETDNDNKGDEMNSDSDNESNNGNSKNNIPNTHKGEDGLDHWDGGEEDDDDTEMEGEWEVEEDGGDYVFDGQDVDYEGEESVQRAKNAGQAYDGTTSAIDMNEAEYAKAKNDIKAASSKSGGHGRGRGNSLEDAMYNIEKMFETHIDWKTALRRVMTLKRPEAFRHSFSKKRLGNADIYGLGKYAKIHDTPQDKYAGINQVFILIDNSGSMIGNKTGSGYDIFDYILSEVITLARECKIENSGLAYFSDGELDKSKIKQWKYKDSKNVSRLIEIIKKKNEKTGGTSIVSAMKSLFTFDNTIFSKTKPKSLLICITDGYDDYDGINNLLSSYNIVNEVFFLITNDNSSHMDTVESKLTSEGILVNHIFKIDTSKI